MSSEEIKRKIADLKIRLAMQLAFEQEAADAVEKSETADAKQFVPMPALESGAQHSVVRHQTQPATRQVHHLSKPVRVLVASLVLMVVSAGSALATAELIQKGLLKLDVQTYQTHTSYQPVYSGEKMEVPESWLGAFYPTYIPDGFTLHSCVFWEAEYRNASGKSLNFSESGYGATIDLDTENANVSTVLVNGVEATLIEKGGWTAVEWFANNRLFVVDMDGNVDEVMKVANSVVMIP